MNYSLIKESDYVRSNWKGGKTAEIAIFPKTKKYIDRNFVWRLSSATIEIEESDFTKLTDYDRILMPIEGEVILTFDGEKTVKLGELEQVSFSGGSRTKSFGKITDFNLMTKKETSRGELDIIEPKAEAVRFSDETGSVKPLDETVETEETNETTAPKYKNVTHALYCRDGYAIIDIKGNSQMVKKGETLLIEYEEGETPEYSIMGEGHLIRAKIRYSYNPEESEAIIIPPEKVCFDDFKCAFFLANTQFRFADKIFKSIRTTWYDEALSRAIRRLEKMYVTFIISIVGIMVVLMSFFNSGMSDMKLLVLISAWLAFDILVISPLIYLIFMPKPIRKHIKDINNLTPYEKEVRKRELESNERIDKILKKYKNSGRNIGYNREEEDDLL